MRFAFDREIGFLASIWRGGCGPETSQNDPEVFFGCLYLKCFTPWNCDQSQKALSRLNALCHCFPRPSTRLKSSELMRSAVGNRRSNDQDVTRLNAFCLGFISPLGVRRLCKDLEKLTDRNVVHNICKPIKSTGIVKYKLIIIVNS